MAAQLFEKDADDALSTGSLHRFRVAPGRLGHRARCRRPPGHIIETRHLHRKDRLLTVAEQQPVLRERRRQVRVQRRQPLQAPQCQLRRGHRIQRPRHDEAQRGGIHRGRQARIERHGAVCRVRPAVWRACNQQKQHSAKPDDPKPDDYRRDRLPVRPPRRTDLSGTPCNTSNTRPPVTGFASLSRTSTACPSRKVRPVRVPISDCVASSCRQ